MQSKLEKTGIEERKNETLKSDYNVENEYSLNHKNALATDDAKGKGTGHGGHTHWLPDTSKASPTIDYSNFDTENGGNKTDVERRKQAMVSSLYNKDYQYGAHLIDSEQNLNQYRNNA